MVGKDAEQELVVAWRALFARKVAVWTALERELGDKHELGASEFEVLERLVEAADSGRTDGRVQEIAAEVHLSQSALSRLIARLERDGLVTRAMCDEDRRGIFVCLTDAGRAKYAEAKPTHRSVLAANLTDQ